MELLLLRFYLILLIGFRGGGKENSTKKIHRVSLGVFTCLRRIRVIPFFSFARKRCDQSLEQLKHVVIR